MFKHAVSGIVLAAVVGVVPVFGQESQQLPEPKKSGGMPVMEALQKRHSSRAFLDRALSAETLSSLLWAANGISRPDGRRTAPTAINVQDTDVYAILATGAYLYDAKANALTLAASGDHRALAGKQDFVKTAPVNLIFVQDRKRLGERLEGDKELFAGVHAGAICQNVYLFCASEGLACVVRRNIDIPALHKALNLRPDQVIVLGQTVGYPAPAEAAH
jgi:Nitroreductase